MVQKPITGYWVMIEEKRIKEAEESVKGYLAEGLLKKEFNQRAFDMYVKNTDIAIITAEKLKNLEDDNYKPHLWVLVASYYSMFYIANAVLLKLGYRIGHKISHKVTADSLVVFVRKKLKEELLKDFQKIQEEALEITETKADELITSFDRERKKRSSFQYEMTEDLKKSKALTSLERAKMFVFEMKKLL